MKLVLTDTPLQLEENKNCRIIQEDKPIKHCMGCFGCWIKTPGECIIKDGYENMGKYLGMCDELVIVSKCTYGCYSPFIKNVLDRSISYISPYFTMRNNEMHHEHRYENKIQITAYFYDTKISENEKKTAMDLVHANALNFDASVKDVFFYKTSDEIKAVIK